jgi:photosystem II stability/assembly factor-like uncharacterized protein
VISNDAVVASAITVDDLWFGSVERISDMRAEGAMGLKTLDGDVKGNLAALADVTVSSTKFRGPWGGQSSGISTDLNAVAAHAENKVWAVGADGTIRKYDGGAWAGQTNADATALNGVSTPDGAKVWAVGDDGVIRYTANGGATAWGAQTYPAFPNLATAGDMEAWASSSTMTYWDKTLDGDAVLERTTDKQAGTYAARFTIDATGPGVYQGEGYIIPKSAQYVPINALKSYTVTGYVKGSASGLDWAMSIRCYNASKVYLGTAKTTSGTTTTSYALKSLTATPADYPAGTAYLSVKCKGLDEGEVLMGTTVWVEFDTVTLKQSSLPALYGVHAISDTDITAVGEWGSIILSADGTTWSEKVSGVTKDLRAVHACDATHRWAVGDDGTILFSADGITWSVQASGTTANLYGVFCLDATHVWAVGENGTILFSANAGLTWVQQASSTDRTLRSIYAADSTHVWAVGLNGTLLYYNGVSWTKQNTNTDENLYGIGGISTTSVWAVGANGIILHGILTASTLPATDIIFGQAKQYSENWNPVLDALGDDQVELDTRRRGFYREMDATDTEVFRFNAEAHKGTHMITAGISFGAATNFDKFSLTFKLQTTGGTDITTQTTTDEIDLLFSGAETYTATEFLELCKIAFPRLKGLTIPSQGVSSNAELSNINQVVIVTADAALATTLWLDYIALIPTWAKVEVTDWTYNTMILDSRSLKAVLASLDGSLDTAQIYDPTKCLGIPKFTADPNGANYTIVCVNNVTGDDQATFIPDVKLVYNPAYLLVAS